jgi:hypothetical protein
MSPRDGTVFSVVERFVERRFRFMRTRTGSLIKASPSVLRHLIMHIKLTERKVGGIKKKILDKFMMQAAAQGMLAEGMWMGVGAAVGLFAVLGGSRFGRQVRKERGLPEFKTGADPARLAR